MATDRDIGPNAMLFYYITAGNQDLTFRMDRMTGEMVTRPAPPDRERQQEYILTVTVEDDGTPPLSVSYRDNGRSSLVRFFFPCALVFLPVNKNIPIRLTGGVSGCFKLLYKCNIPLVCRVDHGDDQSAAELSITSSCCALCWSFIVLQIELSRSHNVLFFHHFHMTLQMSSNTVFEMCCPKPHPWRRILAF